jgi:hypothetical protein
VSLVRHLVVAPPGSPGDGRPAVVNGGRTGSCDPLWSGQRLARLGCVAALIDAEAAVEDLATRQHGVVSRVQALGLGMAAPQIRSRLDRRAWRRVAPGVLGFPGHPDSFERSCWIAQLHAGDDAALSHGTAGLLQRLWPIEKGQIELIVPRGHSRPLVGTRRHRPRSLDPSQVHELEGLRMTTPLRTVLDLSGQLMVPRLVEVVQHCEVEGICPLVSIGAELARVRRRGLPGVQQLETVLDLVGPGPGLPRSELERRGDEVRARAGLPEPQHEHPLPSARGRLGFVDRAWLEAKLIVEYDGRRWHTRRAEIDRDHRRDLEASALGWQPLRMTWEQLTDDPEGTAELWRATYEHRLALLAGLERDAPGSG